MKNKIIRNIFIVLTIIGVITFISVQYILNYVEDAKDYEDVLSVQNKKNEIMNTPGSTEKNVAENEAIASTDESNTEQKNILTEDKADYINLLFLGIDRTDYRDKTMGVYRTDTIIISTIDLKSKKTSVISIPRDTYVNIPVLGKMDKINHAYVWGGMNKKGIESSIETIEEFIKYAKIDYYFALDMEPLKEIIDELGGIEIDVDIEMKTEGANVDKGLQILDGEQAFDYIHWRFAGNGDIDRVKRQQKFLKAVTNKFRDSATLLDAVNIVLKYTNHIQTNLSNPQIIAFTELYKDIKNEDITYYEIPGKGEYIDNISYWIPDKEMTDKNLKEAFNK